MIEIRIDRIPDKEWSYKDDKGIPKCYWYIDEKNLYEYIEVTRFLEIQSKDQEQKKGYSGKLKQRPGELRQRNSIRKYGKERNST